MPGDQLTDPARVLVVARHPLRLDDLGLDGRSGIESVQLIRRPGELEAALDESGADVVIVDTGFPELRSFEVIEEIRALAPHAAVLALTPDPPPHEDVARAARAGARGFIDNNSATESFAQAVEALQAGETWFPDEDLLGVLGANAADLDATKEERRARLTGILIGLIPLTGLIAALMAYLWRNYLGQIGVRPVDLAVDPASRVVDAVIGLSLMLGVFGPLLYIGTWLDMLRGSSLDRGPLAWLLERRKTAHVVASLAWLLLAWVITRGPDLLLVVIAGPSVAVSLIAQAADTSDELPRFMRIDIPPMKVLVGGIVALILFMGLLGGETLTLGPDLRRSGAGGVLVPRILGFKAQPMRAYEVDGEEQPREVLYLGGNADLYVLVDPCNDDQVELVSVGSHRLEVIDEVTCTQDHEGYVFQTEKPDTNGPQPSLQQYLRMPPGSPSPRRRSRRASASGRGLTAAAVRPQLHTGTAKPSSKPS